ncbi:MAG: hypothetical protein M0P69_14845 [Bacteroidales bacterium]|nr:hypothetical protein [Bacteroidales bacterium]
MGQEFRVMIYVGFYTDKYKEEARKLIETLFKFNLNFYVQRIEDLGSWDANTHYKATFIRDCLDIFCEPIVYLDCDARVLKKPVLFDNLDCDIAFHQLTHKYCNKELLSGTLYLDYNVNVLNLVSHWALLCEQVTAEYEQRKLEIALKERPDIRVATLPIEYCAIFDRKEVKDKEIDPVILHTQASRRLRHA